MNFKILAATILAAATVGPVQSTPITYGCDTPADSFSAIEQSIETKAFTIGGNVQPIQFRKGKYAPLAQIYLESADEKTRFAMKIIAEHKAKAALVVLDITDNGQESEEFPIGAVKLSEKLPFRITVTDGSKVSWKIGELEGEPTLALGNKLKLNIICSTGEFVFSDLEWTSK